MIERGEIRPNDTIHPLCEMAGTRVLENNRVFLNRGP